MTLASFQCSYNGLTFGDGTSFEIIDQKGLDDLPGINSADAQKAQDHGEWLGLDWVQGRTFTVDLVVESADGTDATFRSNVDKLAGTMAAQAAELPFTYMLPGMATPRVVNCRPRARSLPTDMSYKYHQGVASVQFHATDPRIYDTTVQTASTGLPAANGGAAWPITWSTSWGASSGAGSFVASNAGTFETRPVITLTGPTDNPTLTNATTGQSISFAITLAATDSLVIDMNAKTVVLNGTASRRGTMTTSSVWWNLPPGNSVIQYRANTVKTGGLMSMQWQSAWL